jgi:hypothetical protein
MTFVSLSDASRRLGIDAKTLHRGLQEAQLPLACHPHDGRKKGVSDEHLQMLASQHHRHLACYQQEEPAPLSSPIPALPADLLKLPEQFAVIQAQLTILQQQVADLTRLMTQHKPGPTIALTPKKQEGTAKPQASPTRSARSTRPAASAPAKTPKKPVHVIPRVEYSEQGHYVVICPKHGVLPIRPDTQEWFAWVKEQDSFRFVGKGGHFTAHHEWRVPKGAWRAHRHIRNHNYIQRLAPNHELTIAVLEQAAEALQAHLA